MTGLVAPVAKHQLVLRICTVADHASHRLEPVNEVTVLEYGPLVPHRHHLFCNDDAIGSDLPDDAEPLPAERTPALDGAPLADARVAERVVAAIDDAPFFR